MGLVNQWTGAGNSCRPPVTHLIAPRPAPKDTCYAAPRDICHVAQQTSVTWPSTRVTRPQETHKTRPGAPSAARTCQEPERHHIITTTTIHHLDTATQLLVPLGQGHRSVRLRARGTDFATPYRLRDRLGTDWSRFSIYLDHSRKKLPHNTRRRQFTRVAANLSSTLLSLSLPLVVCVF